MADVIRLLARQEALAAQRSTWESTWEEVARRVFPRGNDFRQRYAPGQSRSESQFDAFPQLALDRFAAALEAGLTPRTATWHKLTTGEPQIDDDVEVARYLDELNRALWKSRYRPRGNFAGQMHECYLSLGGFGTTALLVEEARDNIGARYRSIHLGELFISENADGIVDTVHRKFEMTARQMWETFRDTAPEKVRTHLSAGKTEEPFEVLHVVEPTTGYDVDRLDQKPFTDIYVDIDSKTVLREGGFYEQPYCVARYVTSSREKYGRSPAIMLMPDIKMLNEMRYATIEAANMAIDPAIMFYDDGSLSEWRIEPGARNPGGVDANGRQLAIPFQSGGRVDIGLEMIQDVKTQIDDAFLGAYFRVLLENPNMTATQALLLAQQQGQMVSPVVGRLQTELLGPLIRRESGILFRQGKHPAMPPQLAEYLQSQGQPLGIDYESPLTRAARSEEAVAVLRTLEALAPLAQIDPTAYRRFKAGEMAEIVARANGLPAKALHSDAEMQAMDEADEATAALGQVLEAAPIAAETARTLSEIQQQAGNNPA